MAHIRSFGYRLVTSGFPPRLVLRSSTPLRASHAHRVGWFRGGGLFVLFAHVFILMAAHLTFPFFLLMSVYDVISLVICVAE